MEELLTWAEVEPTLRRFTIEWSGDTETAKALPWEVTVWSMKSDGSGPRRAPARERGSTLGWAAVKALLAWFASRKEDYCG